MKNPFSISGRLAIEKQGVVFLDAKRISILENIDQYGSINAASKALKMSYQQVWHFLKDMNELSPLPLILQKRGGANGGGAELTTFGKKAISAYHEIQLNYEAFEDKLNQKVWRCFF